MNRILGRLITLGIETPTPYYPKFVVVSLEDRLFDVVNSLDSVPMGSMVCEALESGFAIDLARTLYVPWEGGALVFDLPRNFLDDILWGSPLVRFTDKYNFKGEVN